jgi:hypothetical protein
MKKGEAHMNTVSPALTYLLRCNTDVTSLLSGTAVKAIVAYVTEYVTKPGLKTYSIFDTIRSVFDKNSELIGGDHKRQETARRMLTQVVNALTAKIEVGGPMASLYLLKNPDHYTSHSFRSFYWKSYVRDVWSAWSVSPRDEQSDEILLLPENVIIDKQDDEYIGISTIDDYKYRPSQYEDTSLYNWIRLAKKTKIPKTKKLHGMTTEEGDKQIQACNMDFKDGIQDPPRKSSRQHRVAQPMMESLEYKLRCDDAQKDNESWAADTDSDSDSDENTPCNYFFQLQHQQSNTHHVHMATENELIVPNFIGGVLPRCDRGDREYYCCTMLTLFKPWRTGKDLKDEDQSWDECFLNHKFTDRQQEIIRYFNLRYECLDARDDYSVRRKHGDNLSIFPQWSSDDLFDELDDSIEQDQLNSGMDIDYEKLNINDNFDCIGEQGQRIIEQMMEVENVVRVQDG